MRNLIWFYTHTQAHMYTHKPLNNTFFSNWHNLESNSLENSNNLVQATGTVFYFCSLTHWEQLPIWRFCSMPWVMLVSNFCPSVINKSSVGQTRMNTEEYVGSRFIGCSQVQRGALKFFHLIQIYTLLFNRKSHVLERSLRYSFSMCYQVTQISLLLVQKGQELEWS